MRKTQLFHAELAIILMAALAFSSCTGNTDEATKSPSTEKHGTMQEQIDSANRTAGSNAPGSQPVDTPATARP